MKSVFNCRKNVICDGISKKCHLTIPIVTPCYKGKLDKKSLKNLIKYLNKASTCLFILGTTGEFQNVPFPQKKQLIKEVAKTVPKDSIFFVGIMAKSLTETDRLLRLATRYKAKAAVFAPMYYKNPEKVFSHILSKSKIPLILYNNPHICFGNNLPLPLIKKAISSGKVVAIKDSSGDWKYFRKLLRLKCSHFAVWQGDEKLLQKSLNKADGFVCGSANVLLQDFAKFLAHPNQKILRKINQSKKEIAKLSSDYVHALKQKLSELHIIKTPELF